MYGDQAEDKPAYDDAKAANVVGRFDDFGEDEIIVRQ